MNCCVRSGNERFYVFLTASVFDNVFFFKLRKQFFIVHFGGLNEAEHKKLMDLCRRTGLGPTRLLRKLITDTELQAKPTPELREVLRAVDRIGNNLNQLAHRANTIGLIDQAEWDRVKALHRELREEVYRWR